MQKSGVKLKELPSTLQTIGIGTVMFRYNRIVLLSFDIFSVNDD
jgi:hypothetical protein